MRFFVLNTTFCKKIIYGVPQYWRDCGKTFSVHISGIITNLIYPPTQEFISKPKTNLSTNQSLIKATLPTRLTVSACLFAHPLNETSKPSMAAPVFSFPITATISLIFATFSWRIYCSDTIDIVLVKFARARVFVIFLKHCRFANIGMTQSEGMSDLVKNCLREVFPTPGRWQFVSP